MGMAFRIASVLFLLFVRPGETIANERIVKYVQDTGIASRKYQQILKHYPTFGRRADICPDTAPANADCIRLFVIPPARIRELQGRPEGGFLRGLNLNAKAIRPNLVLIDELLLDFIFVNALNQKQTALFAGQQHDFSTSFAIASLQLLNYFTLELKREQDDYLKHWQPISTVATKHLERGFNEVTGRFASTLISLLIEHEIAHLKADSSWLDRLQDRVAFLVSRASILDEERRADAVALAASSKLLFEDLLKLEPQFREEFNKQPFALADVAHLITSQHLLGFAQVLRDRSLHDAFEGFRGHRAHENLLDFRFKECSAARRDGRLPFADPSDMHAVLFRRLPLLTRSEFDAMRVRLLGPSGTSVSTHDHNLIRAQNIYRHVRKDDKFGAYAFLDDDQFLPLLDALMQNKPELLHDLYRKNFTGELGGAKAGPLVEFLSKGRLEPAVVCPEGECYTSRMDGLGHLELVLNSGKVAYVRGVLQINRQGTEGYVGTVAASLALLVAAGFAAEEALNLLPALREPALRCNFGTALIETEKGILYSSSLDEAGKTILVIAPRTR